MMSGHAHVTLHPGSGSANGDGDRARGVAPDHVVQFYESEEFLAGAVAHFLSDGLAAGQPVVIIATEPHRDALLRRLESTGIDTNEARRGKQMTMVDARETLAAFMNDAMPDESRFAATVGGLIVRSRNGHGHRLVRAYGEMVDLLWADGNTEGAIRLEELWNALAAEHRFSLLCAYAMGTSTRRVTGAASGQSATGTRACCQRSAISMPAKRLVSPRLRRCSSVRGPSRRRLSIA